MKKTILIIIILLIGGVLFWMFKSQTNIPATNIGTKIETTQQPADDAEITTINEDIESIDIGNIDQEFKEIDMDLQGL